MRHIQSLFCGAAIGWLVGLSLSPVLHIVLGSLVALVVSMASIAAGLVEVKGKRLEFDPRFVVWLAVGAAIGAPLGLFARTNDVFGPNPDFLAWRWAGAGINDDQLKLQLFTYLYTPNKIDEGHIACENNTNGEPILIAQGIGLFSAQGSSLLGRLTVADTTEASSIFQTLDNGRFQSFIMGLTNTQIDSLNALVCYLLGGENPTGLSRKKLP